jgi:hypothetical protein
MNAITIIEDSFHVHSAPGRIVQLNTSLVVPMSIGVLFPVDFRNMKTTF